MMKITKDMLIKDIMLVDASLADVLMENGMHCVGCPMHQIETLEQAAAGHGIDVDALVEDLNKHLEK